MPRYAIVFHGSGLSIPIANDDHIVGFYTTLYRSAANEKNALRDAYNILTAQLRKKELVTEDTTSIKIETDSISNVGFFEGRFSKTGLVFYTAADK